MYRSAKTILVLLSLTTAGAVTSTPRLKVEPPNVCWVHTAAGYTPKITLTTTPTEKLEALALRIQFQSAGQPAAPLFSVHEDAEANIHYSTVLKGHTALPAIPAVGISSMTLTAQILPYAARNTTTLGKVQAVSLGTSKLGSTVCKN